MGIRERIATGMRQMGDAIVGKRAQASNLGGGGFGSGYEGAQRSRRLLAFRPTEAAINSLLIQSGPMLRARARHLVRNNPYAKKAQRVFVSALVGTGIRPIPQPTEVKLKQPLTDLWNHWCEEADADGLVDFYGLQVLSARAMFDAGECFMRFRSRQPEDGLAVPFQIQLLESEFCPYELNSIADNGNVIRAGVEFDKIGRRVAYWFWKRHPGEYVSTTVAQGYTRVPAEEVVHLFEPIRPGQIRGVSWLSAAIVRAYVLDQYDDAELERKKTAALFAGFVTKKSADDDGPLAPQEQPAVQQADTAQNAPDEAVAGLTPGMLQVLLEGEDIKFSNPADVGPNFEAFEYRALLGLCAALDMPYSSVTGDRSKATYSSERAAMIDMRAAIAPIQRTVMVFQMCRPTFRRFTADAVLGGSLPIKVQDYNKSPRDFFRATWIPPRLEWVDPFKDIQAEKMAIRAGLKSREASIASLGGDIAEVDDAIARSNKSADDHGLVLDTDPRRTNERGSGPPPDLTAPADTAAPEAPDEGDDQISEEDAA
jgi:lambda family phage portal protein